jgi:predicted amidohydrolase
MDVSLVQLSATRDVDANLETCRQLADRALERGTDWILFPENAPFLGSDGEKREVAEDLDGPMVDHFRQIARDGDVWVTLGSFPERAPDDDRTYNTQVMIEPSGDIAAIYRKLHLFDVDVEEGRSFRESDHVRGGQELVSSDLEADGEQYRVGLSICYDVRFPEQYRALADDGATVLTIPSAFTLQTGRDHWHPLVRARAIENQAWVLAPNQWGHHFGKRSSYGHSVVYDPWGRRVACASDRETIVHAKIDPEYLDEVRSNMPCLEHRRLDKNTEVKT